MSSDIETLKARVKAAMPPAPDWYVSECFFMFMDTLDSSPELLTISTTPEAGKDYWRGLRAIPREEAERRKLYRAEWNQRRLAEAATIRTALETAGFVVKQDGSSLYVKPWQQTKHV